MQCLFRKISHGYEYGAESKALCRSRILAKIRDIVQHQHFGYAVFGDVSADLFPEKSHVEEVRFRIVV